MHRRSISLVLKGSLAKAAKKLKIAYATNLQDGLAALPSLITCDRDGRVEIGPGLFDIERHDEVHT